MFDRLFRRGASVSNAAICVNSQADDSTEALHDAERRIAQLEMLLQQSVIELDHFRALATAKPAKAEPKKPAAVKPVKPAKLSALEFWRLHGVAVAAITAEFGPAWKVTAPTGQSELATLATGYRSAKTERGTVLKWSRDQRIPAAKYWPGGILPDGVTLEQDYARHDPKRIAYARQRGHVAHEIRERHAHEKDSQTWLRVDARARELLADLRAMGKPAAATKRDAAWHTAHGYALHNGVWIAEILLRSQLAHEDGIIQDREFRRVQALERAALSYGPQPAVTFDDIADDLKLAEAAD